MYLIFYAFPAQQPTNGPNLPIHIYIAMILRDDQHKEKCSLLLLVIIFVISLSPSARMDHNRGTRAMQEKEEEYSSDLCFDQSYSPDCYPN